MRHCGRPAQTSSANATTSAKNNNNKRVLAHDQETETDATKKQNKKGVSCFESDLERIDTCHNHRHLSRNHAHNASYKLVCSRSGRTGLEGENIAESTFRRDTGTCELFGFTVHVGRNEVSSCDAGAVFENVVCFLQVRVVEG